MSLIFMISGKVAQGWVFHEPIVLTKDNRRRLNDLVDRINKRIEWVLKKKRREERKG